MRSDDELASCVGVNCSCCCLCMSRLTTKYASLRAVLFHGTVAFSPCYLSPRVDDSASLCFPSPLVDWSWSTRARRTRMTWMRAMRGLVAWAA